MRKTTVTPKYLQGQWHELIEVILCLVWGKMKEKWNDNIQFNIIWPVLSILFLSGIVSHLCWTKEGPAMPWVLNSCPFMPQKPL